MSDLAVVDTSTGEIATRASGPLAALEQAAALLARAETVDEVKDIRDKAEALRLYTAQAGHGFDLQQRCAEIKVRAERKAGELLAAMPDLGPGKGDTLSPLGIAKHQSSRWQRIASVPDDDFEHWVAETVGNKKELTSAGALKLAKRTTGAHQSPAPAAPVKDDESRTAWPAIVIDPPWRYGNTATRAAAEDHYPTMSLGELSDLVIPAEDNAHLYLWTTTSFLREAFDLMDAWEFNYKTTLTWCKPSIGMGNYFRVNTEFVLFGVRGSLPTNVNNVGTWFQADRTRHSAKPESFYDLVEKASPGPWLEMFARRRRFGWDVWGNEA